MQGGIIAAIAAGPPPLRQYEQSGASEVVILQSQCP